MSSKNGLRGQSRPKQTFSSKAQFCSHANQCSKPLRDQLKITRLSVFLRCPQKSKIPASFASFLDIFRNHPDWFACAYNNWGLADRAVCRRKYFRQQTLLKINQLVAETWSSCWSIVLSYFAWSRNHASPTRRLLSKTRPSLSLHTRNSSFW